MNLIETKNAVGHILCHDLTMIVKDEYKDARFRKGHVVCDEDIPILLSMGKKHLYVWEMNEGLVHENDAAERLCKVTMNLGMNRSSVKEGKIELVADFDGLFSVDLNKLNAINALGDIIIATRHSGQWVKKGDKLAAMRAIPLVIDESKLVEAKKIADDKPILSLIKPKLKTAAIITTGSEIKNGLVKDTFTPVIIDKLSKYGVSVTNHIIVDDGMDNIVSAINSMRLKGVDMILCTGGMSVDPDDNTPGAIKKTGANIVSYGAPVMPGAMFLLGYYDDDMPIMGLPGCVMYADATVFDLIVPRVLTGLFVTKADIVSLGNGGLCLGCDICHYPSCSFGK